MRYLAILLLFAGCGIHIEAMSATMGTKSFLDSARVGETQQTRTVDKLPPQTSVKEDLIGDLKEKEGSERRVLH